jgi:dipeptidyl aminopeptidase/acylaminoacyl peptidase
MFRTLVVAAVLALNGPMPLAMAAAQPIPLDDFIKHPQFLDVKVSPTGEYLAATTLVDGSTGALVILRRSDLKMTGNFKLRGRAAVRDFYWVNDERVLLTVSESIGTLANPQATGEIYATNWDGTDQELLIGGRADLRDPMRSRKARLEGAFLVDTLIDDDKHVLVSVFPLGNDEGSYPTLERMNVNTGARSVLARSPVLNAAYVTDSAGQVRFVSGYTIDNRLKTYYRADNDGKWRLFNDEAESGLAMYAVGFTPDNRKAYIQSEEKSGPDAVYLWDPESSERTLVARDDDVDPLGLWYAHDEATPYAVAFMDGLPKLTLIDESVPEAMLMQSLQQSFPGQWVSIRSFTKDGSELVFRVSSDRNPGDYYYLDRMRKATYMLSAQQWIKPEQMAEMKPIQFTARDGVVIHGYLTLPPGSEGKKLPLIVNPHGGPIGPYDDWTFNFEVQLLASRGYAVLQPNFRGSGNYGRAFERMGYRQWGGTMQDDKTDATHWAIEQGIADPERICIYGGSYGGYAAGMGIAKEPDLYRCAVGYVGVYDMQMMYTRGDIKDRDSGTNFLEEALGGGRENLQSRSPNRLVEKIKAPILLVAGGEDVRAPEEHSKVFYDALKRAGRVAEFYVDEDEGHGFYKVDSRRAFYSRVLAWFDRHIGAGRSAETATAP